jgi:hypothetical protein
MWVLEKMGVISAPKGEPSGNNIISSRRALMEEAGYKFDDKGAITEEPEGASEKFAAMLERRREPMPAAAPLAQQSQNQATATAQATTQALSESPQKVEVKNTVVVNVVPVTTPVYFDGEPMGEFITTYEARQNLRNGYDSEASYGGGN